MKLTKTFLPILAGAALVAAWFMRPANKAIGIATSSRLYSVPLVSKAGSTTISDALLANGFVAVPSATFNSLLPPQFRKLEFESLPAFRQAGVASSDTRILGYHPGDPYAQLYVQASGSQEQVQAFQRATAVLQEHLSK